MVKETKKLDRERRVQSTRFAHFWSVPEGDIGCLLAQILLQTFILKYVLISPNLIK